jgi:hypothetical protein
MKRFLVVAALGGLLCAGLTGTFLSSEARGGKSLETRVFELRTYHAHPGKMDALNARFREHTNKLFVKHGMTLIGYWNPLDAKEADKTLIYILAHASKEAAAKSWDAFRNDPEWKAVRAKSEENGPLVAKVESVYMKPTDYSPLK